MELTIIITVSIVAIVVAIIANEIIKSKQGNGSCSCGGACGSCGARCACNSNKNKGC